MIRTVLLGLTAASLLHSAVPTIAEAQRARQGLLSLEDARIFYEVVGSGGEPIVVLHGGPGLDHGYLQPGLDVLANRHEVIYFDQRGTGRSSAELDPGVINLDRFVDDVEQLRIALGHERITVLGHSFGALLALEYAFRHEESTRAVILMNPVEPGQRFAEATAERMASRMLAEDSLELSELRAREGFAARDAATLSQVYRVAFRQVMRDRSRIDDLSLELSGVTARNGQDVAALLGGSLGEVDWWDRVRTLQAPTLVLHGRYDGPPEAMARELADAVPVGTLAILDSGHFPYVEDRDGLVSAVSAFFTGLPR